MKKFRNFLVKPRFFLSIVILPFLIGKTDCPIFVFPPPQPNLSCSMDIPLNLDARKCRVVAPPCFPDGKWRQGETFRVIGPSTMVTEYVSSGSGNIMVKICQAPSITFTVSKGTGDYRHTYRNDFGVGTYAVTINNISSLTVSIRLNSVFNPAVYKRTLPNEEIKLETSTGGGTPPYTYVWIANGAVLPGENDDSIRVSPTRNTEYRVMVRDSAKRVAIYETLVMVGSKDDPTAAFSPSSEIVAPNEQVTFDPSASTGNIIRWEWDFDWQGEIIEPFEQVITGPGGATGTSWSQPGRKYIRLRVATAGGTIHETFRQVLVTAP
jgi:hypothetical protein